MSVSVNTNIVLIFSCPPIFVTVCFVIAFLGCYTGSSHYYTFVYPLTIPQAFTLSYSHSIIITATQLTEQIRISQSQPSRLVGSRAMFFFHSLAFGGVSTWIMHIMSLATGKLTFPDNPSMNVDVMFATGMTALSLVVVLVTTMIGSKMAFFYFTRSTYIHLQCLNSCHTRSLSSLHHARMSLSRSLLFFISHTYFYTITHTLQHLSPFNRHLYRISRSLVLQNQGGDSCWYGGCIEGIVTTANKKV